MYEYLIYSQLKKYAGANKGFHVPGHKARGDFKAKFAGAPLDVTELSYSDNLACPAGVIAGAEKDIAGITGALKSYILTDGSSSGILAMLYAAVKRGNKLIVPRNSHQSVYNACRIFGIEPVIVQGGIRDGVILPPAADELEELLANDINICGMIVASPDYYGNFAPLKEYSEVLKRYERLLIVDEAHGAHLAFEPEEKGYAGAYASVWVDGAHKSLPTLTQGAVVSVNDASLIADIEEGLSIFRTSSPSYPVMASVEYGFKYVYNNKKVYEEARQAVSAFRQKVAFPLYPSDDWTKLVVDFGALDISSDAAAQALEKKGVYAELSDGRYLLFYLSPMTTAAELNSLNSLITSVVSNKKLKGTYKEHPLNTAHERTYSFQYALRSRRELIPVDEAAGRMCARSAGITPPCIPVVVAGEIITSAAMNSLRAGNTFGLLDGKIWVVKR